MSTLVYRSQRENTNTVRQPWPVERKVELVLEGLRGHRPVTELCREANISTARYYQWQRQFIDAGRIGLTLGEAERHKLEERIQQLEAENASLQTRMEIFEDVCLAD